MKYANDAKLLAEIRRTVKEAADKGTMAAMDEAREKLLKIAGSSKCD